MASAPTRADQGRAGARSRPRVGAIWLLLSTVGPSLCAGCGRVAAPVTPATPAAPAAPAAALTSPRVEFEYRDLRGEPVTSATTRGRALCVLFVTTYDLASQVQARRVDEVVGAYGRRAGGLLVVLEEGQYAPLAAAYRDALTLALPVAMADPATLAGKGPFGRIDRVPTLVVLDAEGRETSRRAGVLTRSDVEAALLAALGEPSTAEP